MLTEGKSNKKKSLSSWLLAEPFAYTISSLRILDKASSILSRVFLIGIRIFLRLILGKRKREKLQFYHRLYFRINISFSFYLFMFLYKIIGILRLGNPSFVKINVPKYNYKVYCPVTEDDYMHMTTREDDIIEKFRPNDGEIVVDVGAHYGRYSLIAAKRVGPKGKVIAIEADPENFDMLNKNIKLNESSKENVITLNYAASSNQSKVKLSIPEKQSGGQTIYSSIIPNRAAAEKFVEVNANTLDNLLHENDISLERINWIKIDVEGAELEVLKGASEVLSKSKDISLLIEIHNVDDENTLYEPIMDLLKNYNFKIEFEQVYETGERHIIVSKQQVNWFCKKNTSKFIQEYFIHQYLSNNIDLQKVVDYNINENQFAIEYTAIFEDGTSDSYIENKIMKTTVGILPNWVESIKKREESKRIKSSHG